MKFDLHTHTKYSKKCGALPPKKLVHAAMQRGLNGIAVTDHDTIDGALEAKKYETKDFAVIIGCEITTNEGEITGLFLHHPIMSKEAEDVIDEIHKQGGIAVVPHPFDTYRAKRLKEVDKYCSKIDAIEVFNSRCIDEKSNLMARQFALENNMPRVGGSDAHNLNEIGLGYTLVPEMEGRDTKDLILTAINSFSTDGNGNRSPLYNHAWTKLRKWRRRIVSNR
ncbi:PHP domain-containing protein [Methanolobus sp. WCC4]|uniref:PHP domain-containing protein n=1 Tax=Methanolobus sp. WCC4 TaxID=3125784 RepID=UPI0030F8E7C0